MQYCIINIKIIVIPLKSKLLKLNEKKKICFEISLKKKLIEIDFALISISLRDRRYLTRSKLPDSQAECKIV